MNPVKRLARKAALKTAVTLANHYIKEYGKVLDLHIDPATRTIDLKLLLEGETDPLRVTVGDYDLDVREDHGALRLRDIETSRAWVTNLCRDFLHDRRIEIPKAAANALKLFV